MSTFAPSQYQQVEVSQSMRPKLMVVVDTEEEFDWSSPFSRDARSVENIQQMPRLFDALAPLGVAPLCVMSHPVIQETRSAMLLKNGAEDGLCELGTHLHSWVTPPYDELVTSANSYGCNLDSNVEMRKLSALTALFEQTFDYSPTMFRTGRYGVGPSTFRALKELGYRTDLSLPPHSNFRRDGGPEFYGWSNSPFWADDVHGLMSLPITTGFSGLLADMGPRMAPMLDARRARQFRVPGILSYGRLLERNRLTPEGVDAKDLCRLMRTLVGQGEKALTVSIHSSTLLPGATVYAPDQQGVVKVIENLTETLRFFVEELGGELAAVSAVDAELRNEKSSVCRSLREAG